MIFLLPVPIDDHENTRAISQWAVDVSRKLTIFIVERARTARRYLKHIDHPTPISELRIYEMDKHDNYSAPREALELMKSEDVGILSESGLPGIADPGHHLIRYAHRHNIQVTSLPGPSSILMALQCSGLNGQHFEFVGYLDIQEAAQQISDLEHISRKQSKSIIFIETPYRNLKTLELLLKKLNKGTQLCIAAGISSSSEWIKTKSIGEWRNAQTPDIHKIPAVFVLQA